jgi:hypothetical protein
MNFWEKIKSDVQNGIEEGFIFIKEGAAVVQKKAEELTDEGKRLYRIYELKTKVEGEIAEFGGKVYELSSKMRNPMLDSKVKTIRARIKKLEAEINKLEGKPVTVQRKRTAKKKVTKSKKIA